MTQQDSGRDFRLSELTTTVDCVETLTGLDLLADLRDGLEARVESVAPRAQWDLDTVLLPQGGCAGEPPDRAVAAAIRARILAACQSPPSPDRAARHPSDGVRR